MERVLSCVKNNIFYYNIRSVFVFTRRVITINQNQIDYSAVQNPRAYEHDTRRTDMAAFTYYIATTAFGMIHRNVTSIHRAGHNKSKHRNAGGDWRGWQPGVSSADCLKREMERERQGLNCLSLDVSIAFSCCS